MSAQMTMIAIAVLAMIAIGAGVFAFSGGSAAERRSAKRVSAVAARPARGKGPAGSAADPADKRRKAVAETLKELERKAAAQKARPTLKQMIEQAGWTMSMRGFWIMSAGIGAAFGLLAFIKFESPLIALGIGAAGALGVPRWLVSFARNRRQKAFLVEFANSIDIIVRGVKSGLPLNDTLRMIGQEAPDPVGFEFRQIIEGLRVGMTMEDVLKRFMERMPLPEVNFFQIVLTIQQKTGGNLSEALGNLSAVLRDRKRLQGKIKALSSEAKSSAMIIGSLPGFVLGAVYATTPDYLEPLWNTRGGNLMLVGCVVWMSIGILTMKKMINFKF